MGAQFDNDFDPSQVPAPWMYLHRTDQFLLLKFCSTGVWSARMFTGDSSQRMGKPDGSGNARSRAGSRSATS